MRYSGQDLLNNLFGNFDLNYSAAQTTVNLYRKSGHVTHVQHTTHCTTMRTTIEWTALLPHVITNCLHDVTVTHRWRHAWINTESDTGSSLSRHDLRKINVAEQTCRHTNYVTRSTWQTAATRWPGGDGGPVTSQGVLTSDKRYLALTFCVDTSFTLGRSIYIFFC